MENPPATQHVVDHYSRAIAVVAMVNVLIFVLLGVLVTTHATGAMDLSAVRFANASRSAGMLRLMQTVTGLMAGAGLIVFAVLAGIVYLIVPARCEAAIRLLIGIGGGELITNILKEIYHRPRPATAVAAHLNFSFPSGHSFFAIVVYGLIAHAVADGRSQAVRVAVYLICAILVLLTGLSRIYLGMHFFSDVLSGAASGVVWLIICQYMPLRLRRRTATGSQSRPAK